MRDVGHWLAETGVKLPAFMYLLEFDNAAHREAAWQDFYADPAWWRIREVTNAGAELVESYSLLLLKPSPARPTPFTVSPLPVHELLLQRVRIGAQAAVASHLREELLPVLERHGAEICAVLDLAAGPDIPTVAIFAAWPDHAAQQAGWNTYEAAISDQVQAAGPDAWRSPLLDRSVMLACPAQYRRHENPGRGRVPQISKGRTDGPDAVADIAGRILPAAGLAD